MQQKGKESLRMTSDKTWRYTSLLTVAHSLPLKECICLMDPDIYTLSFNLQFLFLYFNYLRSTTLQKLILTYVPGKTAQWLRVLIALSGFDLENPESIHKHLKLQSLGTVFMCYTDRYANSQNSHIHKIKIKEKY